MRVARYPSILGLSLMFAVAVPAAADFPVPPLSSTDRQSPVALHGYESLLGGGDFTDLEDLVKNPHLDTDADGVTDLVEFLLSLKKGDGVEDEVAGTDWVEKYNLALALAVTPVGAGWNDRREQVFGSPVTVAPYIPCLSPTLETQFDPELLALAGKLDYDPHRIYRWVYENIVFEDYTYSRKGALTTYRTRRGNEVDQSSLLIALLRISGVPARYILVNQYQTVVTEYNKLDDSVAAQAWLPCTKYPFAATRALDSDHDHAWVTMVPWHKSLTLDQEGIDLFPWDAQNEKFTVPSALDIATLDEETHSYLNPDINPETKAFDQHTQQTSIEFFETILRNYLATNRPGKSLKDLPRRYRLDRLPDRFALSTLPAKLAAETDAFSTEATVGSDLTELSVLRASTTLKFKKDGASQSHPDDAKYALLGRWRLDESSGSAIVGSGPALDHDDDDQTPNEVWHAIRAGGAAWQPTGGRVDGSIELDGSNDYIRIAGNDSNPNSGFGHWPFINRTVTMWIRPTSTSGTQVLYDEGSGTDGIALRIKNNRLEAGVATSSTRTEHKGTSAPSFTLTDQWVHVALTFNGNNGGNEAGDNKLRIFINGELATDGVSTAHAYGFVNAPTNASAIGVRAGHLVFTDYTVPPNFAEHFTGRIDDVRVYNAALGVEAIKRVMTDTGSNTSYLIDETVYLPQIAGRRLVLGFEKENDYAIPERPDYEHKVLRARLLLDGQVLDDDPDDTAYLRADSTDDSTDAEFDGDRFWWSYQVQGGAETQRPTIRGGALMSIALDRLAASPAGVLDLARELTTLELADAIDAESGLSEYEAFFGRYATLLTETWVSRVNAAWLREEDLTQLEQRHGLLGRTNVFLWTYPLDPSGLDTDAETYDGSTMLVTPAWRIDATDIPGNLLKHRPSHGWVNVDDEFWVFAGRVAGDTASANEAFVFEDWQGTPSQSTIKGILSAHGKNEQVKVYTYGVSEATVKSDLEWSNDDDFPHAEQQVFDAINQAGTTVYVPTKITRIMDPVDGETELFKTYVYLVQRDGSISWLFGNFNGGGGIKKPDQNIYENTATSTKTPTFNYTGYQHLTVTQNTADQNIFSFNSQQNTSFRPVTSVGDPVDPVTGEFYLEEEPDIFIRSRGPALAVARYYRSQLIYDGPFGFGWAWNHGDSLLFEHDGSTLKTIIYNDSQRRAHKIEVDGSSYTYPAGATFTIEQVGASYELRNKDSSVIAFGVDGRLLSKRDRNGNALTIGYDEQDRLTTITDDIGRSLTLHYDDGVDDPYVDRVVDFTGRSVEYEYDLDEDGVANLVSFTDLGNEAYQYVYMDNAELLAENPLLKYNLEKQILPDGDYLQIHYYKNDTVSHHVNKRGDTFQFQYSWLNRYAETWNEKGYYRKVFWNRNGDVVRVEAEDKVVETTEFDDNHNAVAMIDGNGHETTFEYDQHRNLTKTVDANGNTTYFDYELDFHQIARQIDPRGYVTTHEYDEQGNLETRTIAAHRADLNESVTWADDHWDYTPESVAATGTHVTSYEYDSFGNVVEQAETIHDGAGTEDAVTTFEYDTIAVNMVRSTDPEGRVTQFAYDDLGRVVASTDAAGNITALELNDHGQVNRQSDPSGAVIVNVYDANRRLAQTTNPLGGVSTFEYETPFFGRNFDRVLRAEDPLGHGVTHQYDEVGNRVATTDANGNTTRFRYDELNRLVETIDPLGHAVRHRYDGAGNRVATIVEQTVGDEFEVSELEVRFEYDPANRLVLRHETWGDRRATQYEYDEAGNLCDEYRGYIDGNGDFEALDRVTTEYDPQNRVLSIEQVGDSDGDGNDDQTRLTHFVYDSLGRTLATVELLGGSMGSPGDGSRRTRCVYDLAGNKTDEYVEQYESSDWVELRHAEFEHDDRNLMVLSRLHRTEDWPGGAQTVAVEHHYRHDAAGRPIAEWVEVRDDHAEHPSTGDKTVHGSVTEYDSAGNVVRVERYVGGTWDDDDRTFIGGTRVSEQMFTYNARSDRLTTTVVVGGEQLVRTFQYDGHGNVISSTDPLGYRSQRAYDANNRLVAETPPA